MKSILQTEKKCFVTESPNHLHKHHIFFGTGDRQISEDNGFWVWLRWDHHIADSPNATPHNDRETDLFYKRMCQRKYEETHTREDFLRLIGRNYLED